MENKYAKGVHEMNPNRENEGRSGVVRKGFGITGKLVFAIVGSVVIEIGRASGRERVCTDV